MPNYCWRLTREDQCEMRRGMMHCGIYQERVTYTKSVFLVQDPEAVRRHMKEGQNARDA